MCSRGTLRRPRRRSLKRTGTGSERCTCECVLACVLATVDACTSCSRICGCRCRGHHNGRDGRRSHHNRRDGRRGHHNRRGRSHHKWRSRRNRMTHNRNRGRNRGRSRRIQQHLHRRADFRVRQHLLKRRNEIRSVLYDILQTLFRSGNLIRGDRRQIGMRIHNRCLLSGNLFLIDKILRCEHGQNEQRDNTDCTQDERLRRNLHSTNVA